MSLDPLSADPEDLFSFTDINLDDPPSLPTATTATPPSSSSAKPVSSVSSGNPRFLQWMISMGILEPSSSTWEEAFQNMQSTYEQFVESHPYPQEQAEETKDGETGATATAEVVSSINLDLDPLTAMVQATESEEKRLAEMDLQYRKDKALRNRGKGSARILPESEDYDESLAALQVIDKDLARLADPRDSNTVSDPGPRQEMLRQVLFCYQCENPEPGYRQGMHEIASYMLYALELDTSGTVHPRFQASLTYHLLTRVLVGMAAAFDAGDALPSIGRRVDHIVRTHDPLLGQRLAKLQVPPQMFFTKWIRLLFAREVSNVLEFWDEAFFATLMNDGNFMPLLEAWTAARLLIWSAHFMSIRDDGQLLQTLMNLQVEPETHIWCQVARDLVNRPRGPIQIPPANQQFRPALASPPAPVQAPAPVTLPTSAVFHAPKAPSVAPLKAFLSEAGSGVHLGEWMEQISSKTQILGKRVKQEWEHIAAAAAHPDPQHVYQAPSPPKRQESPGYNITYRGDEPEQLYDPPVPAPVPTPLQVSMPRPLTRNAICKRLDQSSAVLHAYLMQQQSASQVPSTVWHALTDLQKLSRELRPRSTQN